MKNPHFSKRTVFGIGFQRTGTGSLAKALQLLGYRTLHNPKHLLDSWDHPDWGKYHAFCDNPIPLHFRELESRFPEALFILTYRPLDAWLKSVKWLFTIGSQLHSWDTKTNVAVVHQRLYGTTEFDERRFAERYVRHLAEVRTHFRPIPDKLLEIDISKGFDWSVVCDFLEEDVPATPFPRVHGSTGRASLPLVRANQTRAALWGPIRRRLKRHLARLRNKMIPPRTTTLSATLSKALVAQARIVRVDGIQLPPNEVLPEARELVAQKTIHSEPTLWELANVTYSPATGVIYDGNGRMLSESVSTAIAKIPKDRLRPRRDVIDLEGTQVAYRSWRNGYYHTLLDNIPRLAVLKSLDQELTGPAATLLLPGPLFQIEEMALSKLLPSCIGPRYLDSRYDYRIDRLLFPTFVSRRFCPILPADIRHLYLQLSGSHSQKSDRRLLILRRPGPKRSKRCFLNEGDVVDALEPLGFTPVVVEELPLVEQLDLFARAQLIVGAHGAGLANIVFYSATAILELFPSRFVVPHYQFLSSFPAWTTLTLLGQKTTETRTSPSTLTL